MLGASNPLWNLLKLYILRGPDNRPLFSIFPGYFHLFMIRPFIEKALGKELNGERGHWMRVAVTREYHNLLGYSDEEIAELFETQSDYDFEYSLGR